MTWEVPGIGLKDEPSALKHPEVRLVVPLSWATAMRRNAERFIFGPEKQDVNTFKLEVPSRIH